MQGSESPSLVDALFDRLQREIVSGELAPAMRLPSQKDLAERENVSRTVVREAVSRLVAHGLAVSRQGAGVFVADNARYQAFQVTADELGDLEDVLELLELRSAVEAEMASLAAARRSYDDLARIRKSLEAMDRSTNLEESVAADVAFHTAIAAATRTVHFHRFIEFLGVRLVPPRNLYLRNQGPEAHEAYARQIANDHRRIFQAIADQDPVEARAAARRHMQESLERHAQLGQLDVSDDPS